MLSGEGEAPGSLPEAQEQAHFHSGLSEASAAADRHAVCGTMHVQGHHNRLCTPQLGQAPETGPSSDKALCCGTFLVTLFPQEKGIFL